MGLKIYLDDSCGNNLGGWYVTYNLVNMAKACGNLANDLFDIRRMGYTKAGQLEKPYRKALTILLNNRKKFEVYNPKNGWGSFDDLCKVLYEIVEIASKNPNATITTFP